MDKLDNKKTFLLGFGFLGVSLMWVLYNSFVPVFLQAGAPGFEGTQGATTAGFGLSAALAGFIMTLDNIAAFFIQPVIGVLSDRTHTRWGRRMPYILGAVAVAAAAFVLIPVAVNQIPAALSGQAAELGSQLAFFMVAIGIFLLAMAVFRTPVIALMPDITPSRLRSKANGVINLMGGVGGLLATFGGAALYRLDKVVPFVFGAIVMVVAGLVVFAAIKEPQTFVAGSDEEERWWDTLKQVGTIPTEERRSLVLILLAIFAWFVGYNAIETFFTSPGLVPAQCGFHRRTAVAGRHRLVADQHQLAADGGRHRPRRPAVGHLYRALLYLGHSGGHRRPHCQWLDH